MFVISRQRDGERLGETTLVLFHRLLEAVFPAMGKNEKLLAIGVPEIIQHSLFVVFVQGTSWRIQKDRDVET